ncbi:hypothetical protein VZT92_017961 [Zoarces viviparus]|uniref:Secreted protein n=1 Tax=Zoarces viviparus TaxID=48416 RepID=A0AAW1ES44_ZOAVI
MQMCMQMCAAQAVVSAECADGGACCHGDGGSFVHPCLVRLLLVCVFREPTVLSDSCHASPAHYTPTDHLIVT